MLKYFLFLGFFLTSLTFVFAQQEDFPTHVTEFDKRMEKYKPSHFRSSMIWYVSEKLSPLYGNPCTNEVTQRMGFLFEIHKMDWIVTKTEMGKFINNRWVGLKLSLRYGPWWRAILNKKLENCKHKTGDEVG